MNKFIWIIVFLVQFFTVTGRAEVEHNLLRKIAVFPIAEANVDNAEEAWWQMRENLTRDKKLLIASKRFMINRGVFQPRKKLKPADAIILGRLLDAQALMVTYFVDRKINCVVYDGENGYILWKTENELHPAIPINDQIIKVSTKLASDFLQAIPYQGFVEKDPSSEKIIIEKNDENLIKVFVGGAVKPEKGDPVQIIKLTGDASKVFFDSMNIEFLAEGEVLSFEDDHAWVKLNKVSDPELIEEESLIRFPKEMTSIRNLYHSENTGASLSNEYLNSELKPINEFKKEHQPGATAIAILINLAAFVLIAF